MADKREALQDGITKVTSERTGKVSYESRWSWFDAAGERQHGRKRFNTLKAAKAHRARMVASISDGGHTATSRLTVAEYYEQWLPRRKLVWTTATAYTREWQWRKYLSPAIGGVKLVHVTRQTCQAIVTDLAAQFAPAMVRNVYALLFSIFKGALIDGHIRTNPAVGVDLPPVAQRDHEVWSPDQVRTFLASSSASPCHALYVLLLTTGVRISEALALRWENVSLRYGTATIKETLRRTTTGRYEPVASTKTGKFRSVPLTKGCISALTALQAEQEAQREEDTTWNEWGFVFPRADGRPLDHAWVNAQLRRDIDASGVTPALTLHGFRHTVATMLMIDGVQDRAIQDLLGHAQVSTTMNMYAHVTERLRRTTSERVSALLETAPDTTTTTSVSGQKPH